MAAGSQHDESPSRGAFSRFLKWLDEGTDSSGERYLEMRHRLVQYFDRKNCLAPEELADETLNRVARRLEEEGSIADTSPAHYCYIVARFVFLEYQRRPWRKQVSLDRPPDFIDISPHLMAPAEIHDTVESQPKRLNCLEGCLRALDPASHDLIFEYYRGEKRVKIELRRQLAGRLGVTMNALSIRACRIREKLEDCVKRCWAKA